MSRESWMANVEKVEQDYAAGIIDEDEFRSALRAAGFDNKEIEKMKSALDQDRENDGTL